MKILKVLGILFCLTLIQSANAGSALAGVQLGSDFKVGCEKLKPIFAKKEPKLEFKTSKDRCGFEFGTWVGIKAKDGKTIDYIGIKHTTFGFPFNVEIKELAQAYVLRLDAVSHIMDYDEAYKAYIGTNLLGTEKVMINGFVTSIATIGNKPGLFDLN